jgi:hypothetical protein
MNRWVQRGLRTALLTGGLLAAGAGVAAADENDLSADLLGATVTVPVQDGAVLGTPVVTGTGEDLTVGDGVRLPVDTDTAPGTTVLGDGGASVPVRVTEADDRPPSPADGLTVTVPAGTSGGGTAGTTVTVPVVTGDLGDVLDGDPLTGDDVDVDLTDPVVTGPDGHGLVLGLQDTVTIGDTDGTTTPATVLELPVGLDAGRPSTVALPLPSAAGDGGPLSREDVDVSVGGDPGAEPSAGDPALSLPISTGDLLSDLLGGDALRDDTVDVDLGDLLGGAAGPGSPVTVPVNEDGTGTGSDSLVRVTLPIGLTGLLGSDGRGPGDGGADGSGPGSGEEDGGPDSGPTVGTGAGIDGRGTAGTVVDGDCGRTAPASGASGADASGAGDAGTGTPGTVGPTDGGPHGDGPGSGGPGTGSACGTGIPQAVTTQSAPSTAAGPVTATAGILALAGLLLAITCGRLARHRA